MATATTESRSFSSNYQPYREEKALDVNEAINLTISLVKQVLEQFDKENSGPRSDKDKYVVVMGDSGSGKSTLINIMARNKLNIIEHNGESRFVADKPFDGFKIGLSKKSETSIARSWKDKTFGIVYWDCPGFKDNRTWQEIANAICIQKIFNVSAQVKFLMLVKQGDLYARRPTGFQETMKILDTFVDDLDSIASSTTLVVTNVATHITEKHIKNRINEILKSPSWQNLQKPCNLLTNLVNRPIVIFHKPLLDGSDYNFEALKNTIENNLQALAYAENVKVNLCLSNEGKRLALDSYNVLAGYIQESIKKFMEAFEESVNSFAKPCSDYDKPIPSSERTEATQKKYKDLLTKLQTLIDIEYDFNHLGTMIINCSEIAQGCGKMVSQEDLAKAIESLGLMKYLEQFIDPDAYLPFELLSSLRSQAVSAYDAVNKSLTNILRWDAKDQLELETKRALDAQKLADKEAENAKKAKERYEKVKIERKYAEIRLRDAYFYHRRNDWELTCSML